MVTYKEYEVPDIIPLDVVEIEGITIEVRDAEKNPIPGAKFRVAVDGGEEKSYETDADGLFEVPRPETGLKARKID